MTAHRLDGLIASFATRQHGAVARWQLLDLGQPVTAEDCLGPGDPVVVRSGPLAGLTGTVVRAGSGHKFVVRVDLIQRGVSVVVDRTTLGRLG